MSEKLKPSDWSGYKAHTKARTTKTTVVLVNAEEQGLNKEDGGKWALICDDHGYLIQDNNQANLRGFLAHPEDWCEPCRQSFFETEGIS